MPRMIYHSVPAVMPESAFIAADIGGTHARVGLVAPRPDGRCPVTLLDHHDFTCSQYEGLTPILQDFIRQFDVPHVNHCVIACAGYVLDGVIANENLPWRISIHEICEGLAVEHLAVINDFEALAYAIQFLEQDDVFTLVEAKRPRVEGPMLVSGPGTGLGCSLVLPGTPYSTVVHTEAAHSALAPGNVREMDILRLFLRDQSGDNGYVSNEYVLSGPGLLHLYRAVATLQQVPVTLTQPAEITRAALDRCDEAAIETLDMFCGLLGSFIGDMVLIHGALGGVFLAGGILPQMVKLLQHSRFTGRFFNKGATRTYLEQVPVWLMEHGQHGVTGAASLYLTQML